MQSDIEMNLSEVWSPLMQQRIFRGLLDAYSYPGRVTTCADRNIPAWLAILTALVDGETTLADPHQLLSDTWWQKLEARRAPPEQAAYILLDGSLAPELLPNLGTLEAPEAGATLLMRVESLHSNAAGDVSLCLIGPGIRQQVVMSVNGLHSGWVSARNDWVANFPLGVEMVLCDAHSFVALPRSTRIVMGGAA